MQFERLSTYHDRQAFDCGNADINCYLQQYASQHAKKGIAKIHVLADSQTIKGFYTLSNAIIDNTDGQIKGYPKQIPAIIIGRIGVEKHFQGQGLSNLLLSHALRKIQQLSDDTGIAFVIIDAKDEKLAAYYQKFGFRLTSVPLRLILSASQLPKTPNQSEKHET